MTLEIPDLTKVGILFFLFALFLTSFAKWFSGHVDKATSDNSEIQDDDKQPELHQKENFSQPSPPPSEAQKEEKKTILPEAEPTPTVVPPAEQKNAEGKSNPAQE